MAEKKKVILELDSEISVKTRQALMELNREVKKALKSDVDFGQQFSDLTSGKLLRSLKEIKQEIKRIDEAVDNVVRSKAPRNIRMAALSQYAQVRNMLQGQLASAGGGAFGLSAGRILNQMAGAFPAGPDLTPGQYGAGFAIGSGIYGGGASPSHDRFSAGAGLMGYKSPATLRAEAASARAAQRDTELARMRSLQADLASISGPFQPGWTTNGVGASHGLSSQMYMGGGGGGMSPGEIAMGGAAAVGAGTLAKGSAVRLAAKGLGAGALRALGIGAGVLTGPVGWALLAAYLGYKAVRGTVDYAKVGYERYRQNSGDIINLMQMGGMGPLSGLQDATSSHQVLNRILLQGETGLLNTGQSLSLAKQITRGTGRYSQPLMRYLSQTAGATGMDPSMLGSFAGIVGGATGAPNVDTEVMKIFANLFASRLEKGKWTDLFQATASATSRMAETTPGASITGTSALMGSLVRNVTSSVYRDSLGTGMMTPTRAGSFVDRLNQIAGLESGNPVMDMMLLMKGSERLGGGILGTLKAQYLAKEFKMGGIPSQAEYKKKHPKVKSFMEWITAGKSDSAKQAFRLYGQGDTAGAVTLFGSGELDPFLLEQVETYSEIPSLLNTWDPKKDLQSTLGNLRSSFKTAKGKGVYRLFMQELMGSGELAGEGFSNLFHGDDPIRDYYYQNGWKVGGKAAQVPMDPAKEAEEEAGTTYGMHELSIIQKENTQMIVNRGLIPLNKTLNDLVNWLSGSIAGQSFENR